MRGVAAVVKSANMSRNPERLITAVVEGRQGRDKKEVEEEEGEQGFK